MEMETEEKNKINLKGKILEEPVFSHESFGEKFYETEMAVERLSGEIDNIKIIISKIDLETNNIKKNDYVDVIGQIRSYNHYFKKDDTTKRKLVINVFVKEIKKITKEDTENGVNTNKVNLIGYVCKEPIYRKTPFGREISDILIAVNRQYNKSDYLPTICWGRTARFAKNLKVGELIELEGRLQSRKYTKVYDDGTEEEKIAYEISVIYLKACLEDELEEDKMVEE